MADRWLNEHIEKELKKHSKQKQKSILDTILEKGYVKIDTNLRHFDVYEKGSKRILYSPSKKEIDMIYDTKKVFERINRSIDLEVGE